MEYKFMKGYSYPVRVDERLLTALDRIGGAVRENYTKKVVSDNKLTNADIENGPPTDIDDFDRSYQVRSALKEIENNIPKYSCEFSSGTSLQSKNLGDILDSLQSEPSDIQKIEATYGSYSGCRFTYRFDSSRSYSVWISIDGSRSEVNDIRVQVENALRSSHPDFQWFYHPAIPTLIGFIFVFGWIHFGIKTALPAMDSLSINGGTRAVITAILLAITIAIAAFMSTWYSRILPQVSFAFGNRYRQKTSIIMFSVWVIAAFVVPVFLAIAGLT